MRSCWRSVISDWCLASNSQYLYHFESPFSSKALQYSPVCYRSIHHKLLHSCHWKFGVMVVFKSSKTKRKKRKETPTHKNQKNAPGSACPPKSKKWRDRPVGRSLAGLGESENFDARPRGRSWPRPRGDEKGSVFLRRAGVGNIMGYLGVNGNWKRSGWSGWMVIL